MDTEVIDKLNDKTQEADIFGICQKYVKLVTFIVLQQHQIKNGIFLQQRTFNLLRKNT